MSTVVVDLREKDLNVEKSVRDYLKQFGIKIIRGRPTLENGNQVNDEILNYLLQNERNYVEVKGKNGEIVKINGKTLKFTKFDFKEIGAYSDDELKIIILADTGVNLFIDPEGGLVKLNKFISMANNDRNLGIIADIFKKRKIPRLPEGFKFNDIEELFDFMRTAGKDSPEAQMKCMMLKITSGVADVLKTPGLENLQQKLEILLIHLNLVLGLRQIGDTTVGQTLTGKKITIFGRAKTLESLLGKTLGDPEYDKISRAKDGVGLTFELKEGGKNDYLSLFSEVLNGCLALGGELVETKSKGLTQDEILDFIRKNSNLSGIKGIENISVEKKSGTEKGYIDLKFSIKFGDTIVEIKITPPENKNQEGLHFQGIYAVLNRYIEGFIIRHLNNGYITENELEMMGEIFFEHLQRLINENPEVTGMLAEEFLFGKEGFKGLWEDMQERGLIRTDVKPMRKLEKNIVKYFIPGIVNHYKGKLKGVRLADGTIVWTNDRGTALYQL